MNWQIFSTIGYLGIGLGVAALALWLFHWKRPHRWLPVIGLALAIGAVFSARENSTRHISRIDVDPSAYLAEIAAREKAKRDALLESRSDEVAKIEFAEDGGGDFYDKAGMDEVDLKYHNAILEGDTPEWKKRKQARGNSAKDDDSLEAQIGAKEETSGADVSEFESLEAPEPIYLSESEVVLANHLDRWNLVITEWLVVIAAVVLLLDYLRRANHYREALWPVPLPSSWLNAFNPMPSVRERPRKPRRDTIGELKWLSRRGDSWIHFSDKPEQTSKILESLKSMRRWPYRLDLLRADERIDDDFIFESVWYGRASFIVDSAERRQLLLDHLLRRLELRRSSRASSRATVHLVWDCATALPESTLQDFRRLAAGSGISFFFIQQPPASP